MKTKRVVFKKCKGAHEQGCYDCPLRTSDGSFARICVDKQMSKGDVITITIKGARK